MSRLRTTGPALLMVAFFVAPAHAQTSWRSVFVDSRSSEFDTSSDYYRSTYLTEAVGVNDHGTIVGSTGQLVAGVMTRRGSWWTVDGYKEDLGKFLPRDVNNAGILVGSFRGAPAKWARGENIVTLGPAGYTGVAAAINEAGQIVGTGRAAGTSSDRAFLWSAAAGLVELDALGGDPSAATDINDLGMVVGSAQTASGRRAFVKPLGMPTIDLGTLDGAFYRHATAINNHGQVVGWTEGPCFGFPNAACPTPALRAFIWTAATGMQELPVTPNDLSAASFYPADINDAGQVVGFGQGVSYLWTPREGLIWLGRGSASAINTSGAIVGAAPSSWAQQDDRCLYMSDDSCRNAALWSRANWDYLALDLGAPYGLWTREPGARWTPLVATSPEALLFARTGGNGDTLIVDFGPSSGVFAWLGRTTWQQLHPSSPREMIAGDLDGNGLDDLVFDFPGFGVWALFDTGVWFPLHPFSARHLAIGRLDTTPGAELIADFEGFGLWAWHGGGTWTRLHVLSARSINTADLDGNGRDEIVIDFPGSGLWVHADSGHWWPLNTMSARHVGAGDLDGNGQRDLVIDFGPSHGIWAFVNNTTWTPLKGVSGEQMLLVDLNGDGKAEVVINLGAPYGLWQLSHAGQWWLLNATSPLTMAAGRLF